MILVGFFFAKDPPVVWTEDYQVELMEQNFAAFDQLRRANLLVGEMIWNFADFATPQGNYWFHQFSASF